MLGLGIDERGNEKPRRGFWRSWEARKSHTRERSREAETGGNKEKRLTFESSAFARLRLAEKQDIDVRTDPLPLEPFLLDLLVYGIADALRVVFLLDAAAALVGGLVWRGEKGGGEGV